VSITERELELLRQEQTKFFPNEATCKRSSYVGGEQVAVPNTVFTSRPCRFTPGFGVWRQVADQYVGITAYTVTFAYETDVKAGDQLIDDESRSYQVRDVLHPKGYETAVRALLDLVTD